MCLYRKELLYRHNSKDKTKVIVFCPKLELSGACPIYDATLIQGDEIASEALNSS
jgi:hypothetical protein